MTTKGTIYVIDDDEAMRDSLNFLLDSAGFGVTLFDNAQSFLDALPGLAFGCVVSDVRMPGIDGIELLKRLKAQRSRFPILIMTGHGDVPLAVEAMKLGAMDFLEKPFEDDRLVAMIESAIREGEPAARNEAMGQDVAARVASLSPQRTTGHGGADRGPLQQADRSRVRHQPAHHRGLPGQRNDQDAGQQPVGAGPASDARRNAQ
ncbi:two-component system response regulator FixJ [Bradyrhizobium sp. GM6.1]